MILSSRREGRAGALRRRFEVPQYSQVGNAVSPFLAFAVGLMIQGVLEIVRLLTQTEVNRLNVLSSNGVSYALLEPTAIALGKGIIDAVEGFRKFLVEQNVHDFSTKPQGEPSKRIVRAFVLTADDNFVRADASLYRPTTKAGDPRVWFSRLKPHADANDILAIATYGHELYVFNVTRLDLAALDSIGWCFRPVSCAVLHQQNFCSRRT